jgi:hypothetical protein
VVRKERERGGERHTDLCPHELGQAADELRCGVYAEFDGLGLDDLAD